MHPIVQKWLPRIVGAQINAMSWIAPQRAAEKSFGLFATPRKGRLRPKDEQFLAAADSHLQVDTPHGKIQTYSWNKTGKQTVLLLHGWESNAARWRFLIPLLVEQNYRVVAMDAPAHGQSEGKIFHMPKYAESIHHVMQAYQADLLIGHSIGGMAVAYYLSHYEYPKISKAIIMGAPDTFERMLWKFAAFLKLSKRTMKVTYQFLEKKFDRHPSYFSIDTFCKDFSMPVLIIHDEGDQVVPFEASQAYINHLTEVELMKTRNLGHSLRGESVYQNILHFFKEKESVKN